jgi:hypothetical protein
MYIPESGRWLTLDPSHEDGGQESTSPYGYVFNNPVKLIDPDGRLPIAIPIIIAIVEAISAAVTTEVVVGVGAGAVAYGATRTMASSGTFPGGENQYANWAKSLDSSRPQSGSSQGNPEEKRKKIYVDGKKHPESATHLQEAKEKGNPLTGVVDRQGTKSRRNDNMKGVKPQPKKDRDEAPPAVVKPDGEVSV